MKRSYRFLFITLLFLGLIAITIFYMMTHNIAVLDPKGLIAAKEKELLVIASLLMLIVIIPVFFLLLFFAWRYRSGNKKAKFDPEWEDNATAEIFWWGIPFIIIVVLAVITWKTTHELNPFTPIASHKNPLTVQVIALEWKWLFIYPEEGIATINFVQIPENRPIAFEITADAPMNSFWIPQLGGQIYAMPAMRTKLHLLAHEKGDYRGASANISGKGFAGMNFTTRVSGEEEFEDWVSMVQETGVLLDLQEYNLLLRPTEYDPVSYYSLVDHKLFDHIIDKYKRPTH